MCCMTATSWNTIKGPSKSGTFSCRLKDTRSLSFRKVRLTKSHRLSVTTSTLGTVSNESHFNAGTAHPLAASLRRPRLPSFGAHGQLMFVHRYALAWSRSSGVK